MVVEQSLRTVSTSNTQFTRQKGKSDAIYSHCGYSGHLVDKCFQLIGYPPGWKGPRGKRFNSTPTAAKNFQRLPTANNTNVLEQNSSNSNMIFSQEQIQNLLTLANSLPAQTQIIMQLPMLHPPQVIPSSAIQFLHQRTSLLGFLIQEQQII